MKRTHGEYRKVLAAYFMPDGADYPSEAEIRAEQEKQGRVLAELEADLDDTPEADDTDTDPDDVATFAPLRTYDRLC